MTTVGLIVLANPVLVANALVVANELLVVNPVLVANSLVVASAQRCGKRPDLWASKINRFSAKKKKKKSTIGAQGDFLSLKSL